MKMNILLSYSGNPLRQGFLYRWYEAGIIDDEHYYN